MLALIALLKGTFMKKILLSILAACFAAAALFAETAQVRTHYVQGRNKTVKTKTVELEKVAPDKFRLVIPKSQITDDMSCIDIVPEFAKANKGDEGYWIMPRGTYGKFDKDNGFYSRWRHLMPIFGMKKGDKMFWGHMKTYRFDFTIIVEAKNGKYEIYPRVTFDTVRKYMPIYDDIVVEFNMLSGKDADYNGMAKGYQKYQLESGAVRTIKDRIKDFPQLDYLCESIVVRIQTHGAKPISEKRINFTKENELPVIVHMPFGVSEEFAKAIKDSGVDKVTIVSAGWNYGGYDGRTPQHFPVEETIGGEEGLKRLCKKVQDLGFQFTLHATNTDGYTVSPMWNPDWVGKRADGSLDEGGLWAGGSCFNVCQNCSWHNWVPQELKKMAALGAKGPHYIDVYSATYPNRCADPNHPATPEQMAEYQNKILAMSKQLFGGASSESGYDHVAGNIDYINYIERDLKMLWENKHNKLVSGVYPLWELVYHGIILYNSDRATQNHTRGKCLYKIEKSGDPRWMEGDGIVDPKVSLKIVEFGGRPIFYTYKFADVPRIKRAWDEFVPVRHLQKEMMTRHDEIAENVFVTEFGEGSKIVSNYNKAPYNYKGTQIKPISYILINPDGSIYQPKPF